MKILIFIHGGESFTNETDYHRFLTETYITWQSDPWSPEMKTSWVQEIAKKWYASGNQVFMPVFPNKLNAKYKDWKIVFDGIFSGLDSKDEVTLVGGSLGGCFLLKYFSENPHIPYTISQIHLVAACLECGDFTPPINYEFLQQIGNRVNIWHAEDDTVVPFAIAQEIKKELSEANTHFFGREKGYGHFHAVSELPELETAILQK